MADIYRPEIPSGIRYVPIEISATTTIIFGVTGKSIVVLSAWLVGNAAVNAKFQTSAGPVNITGPAYCAQNGGIVLPFNAGGWFATAPGDSLILNLSSGVAVGGSLSYVLV